MNERNDKTKIKMEAGNRRKILYLRMNLPREQNNELSDSSVDL